MEPKVINNSHLDNWETIQKEYNANKPFPHTALSDFIDDALLTNIKSVLGTQEWFKKNNDLYKFEQTDDLKLCNNESIVKLKEALYSTKFLQFLTRVTGIELNATVDMAGSRYDKGDTLLCHDDQLEGRRIAFILYLVPEDWSTTDGGNLDLFDTSPQGQPANIVHSIPPKRNNFVFFTVSPISFHQVAEVLGDRSRLSISGWFHGSRIIRPPKYIEPKLPRSEPSVDVQYDLSEWLAAQYLEDEIQAGIKHVFDENSSIALYGFLKIEKYSQIVASLGDQPWSSLGPYNRRHYQTLGRFDNVASKEVGPLKELKKFLMSKTFADYIEKITGIEPWRVFSESRKFEPSCYTLVHDNTEQHAEGGLDVMFNMCQGSWTLDNGGFTTYMEEEDELITLKPCENSIALVYRDEGCMSFVKYLEHTSVGPKSDIWMVVWEDPDREDSDDDEDMEQAPTQ